MPFFIPKAFLAFLTAAAERADVLERELAAARAINRTLERQNAVSQANAEWLRDHVNRLTDERARLMLRELNVITDPPEIVGMPSAASTSPRQTAHEEKRAQTERVVAESTSGAAMFEDMGDEAAAAQGINHDPSGAGVYPD